jgi:hypothetical protein
VWVKDRICTFKSHVPYEVLILNAKIIELQLVYRVYFEVSGKVSLYECLEIDLTQGKTAG